jgi:hypothetical protein
MNEKEKEESKVYNHPKLVRCICSNTTSPGKTKTFDAKTQQWTVLPCPICKGRLWAEQTEGGGLKAYDG